MPQNTHPALIGNQNIYLASGVSKIASIFPWHIQIVLKNVFKVQFTSKKFPAIFSSILQYFTVFSRKQSEAYLHLMQKICASKLRHNFSKWRGTKLKVKGRVWGRFGTAACRPITPLPQ